MSKGKPRRTARDLSRDQPSYEELEIALEKARESSDVALAIILCAHLEYEIERLIVARLKRRDQGTLARLTDNTGPMPGLHAKVVLAYALGVFDEIVMHNMGVIRNIRNAFAHTVKHITFDTPEIRDEMRKLRLPAAKRNEYYKSINKIRHAKADVLAGRDFFRILCAEHSIIFAKKQTKISLRRVRYLEKKTAKIYGGFGNAFGASFGDPWAGPTLAEVLQAARSTPETDKK